MATLMRFFTAVPVAAAVVAAPNAANIAATPTATAVAWTATAASMPFDPPTPVATIFEVGGVGWEDVPQQVMKAVLGYRYNGGSLEPGNGNDFVNIPWPGKLGDLNESVQVAADDLYGRIGKTPGPEVAVGLSGSTFVINEVMRRLQNDPNPPADPSKITFVAVGDGERGLLPAIAALIGPNLPLVNYTVQPIPVTKYNMIVVTGEYDGLADWPDRPWNLLADLNAWLGSPAVEGYGDIHWNSILNSLDAVPAKNITTEMNTAGGTTISYLVPTPELPLLYPLHAMGVPQSAIDVLNSVLKPIVDLGYSRNDPDWLKKLTGAGAAVAPPASATNRAAAPVALSAASEAVEAPTVKPARALRNADRSTGASAPVGTAPSGSAAKRVAATAAVAPTAKPAGTRRAAATRPGPGTAR